LFELTSTDLLGRLGTIKTAKGDIRTPCFVPVVHPVPGKNLIDVSTFQSIFDVDLIITSSYILRKRFAEKKLNLHELTSFSGPIMTDSGAYQSLVYGEVEITPENAISYQELIESDFGVPLDIPISKNDSYEIAHNKVETTLERCKNIINVKQESDVTWLGPIQGGKYLDLIEKSAKTISSIDTFGMFAIGSVVEIMNDYRYDILLEMILTAKQFLDPRKPIHLFGAGHPSIFPFIVAAGCDSFDSASYALYAQDDRYITNTQTFLLEDLEAFPCNCPMCLSSTPQALKQQPKKARMKFLAAHNLHACQAEIRNIRRAISSGTLWELLENRSTAHPNLKKGFDVLKKYSAQLAKNTRSTKKKGIFLLSENSFYRPEVLLHKKRIKSIQFGKRKKLFLISLINSTIAETYPLVKLLKEIIINNQNISENYEVWLLDPYFNIIPLEINEVFPLVQYIGSGNISKERIRNNILDSLKFIDSNNFNRIIILGELGPINSIINQQKLFQKLKIESIGFSLKDSNINIFEDIINNLIEF